MGNTIPNYTLTEDELKTIYKTTSQVVSFDSVFQEKHVQEFKKNIMSCIADGDIFKSQVNVFSYDLPEIISRIEWTSDEFKEKRNNIWSQIHHVRSKIVGQILAKEKDIEKQDERKQREIIEDLLTIICKPVIPTNETPENTVLFIRTLAEHIHNYI